jgi:hypothetical protein
MNAPNSLPSEIKFCLFVSSGCYGFGAYALVDPEHLRLTLLLRSLICGKSCTLNSARFPSVALVQKGPLKSLLLCLLRIETEPWFDHPLQLC